MSDLIKRLRYEAREVDIGPYGTTPLLLEEAADEIERLEAIVQSADVLIEGHVTEGIEKSERIADLEAKLYWHENDCCFKDYEARIGGEVNES